MNGRNVSDLSDVPLKIESAAFAFEAPTFARLLTFPESRRTNNKLSSHRKMELKRFALFSRSIFERINSLEDFRKVCLCEFANIKSSRRWNNGVLLKSTYVVSKSFISKTSTRIK